MTIYTWKIARLDCHKELDGYESVVHLIGYVCTAFKDGQEVKKDSNLVLEYEPSAGFTPFLDLTEPQILEWLFTKGVDKEATENELQAELDKKMVNISAALPWVVPDTDIDVLPPPAGVAS